MLAEKENVEDLNDNCELLMEQSACTRIRDQTIETQANYTKLLTAAQGLVAKIEKNLSDHTEFLNYKKEMDAWIEKAQQVLNDCSVDGDAAIIAQKLETVNVSAIFQNLWIIFKHNLSLSLSLSIVSCFASA